MKYSILILLITCQSMKSQTTVNDSNKRVVKCFGIESQNNLSIILDFYDNYLLTRYEEDDIEVAYNEYFKELNETKTFEDFGNAIHIDSISMKKLLSELNPIFINSFWNCLFSKKEYRTSNKTDFFFMFEINPNDELICFLESVSRKHKYLDYYYDGFMLMKDISSSITYSFHKNYEKYDLCDESIRLLTAIHYITLNMPYVKY